MNDESETNAIELDHGIHAIHEREQAKMQKNDNVTSRLSKMVALVEEIIGKGSALHLQ